jgi:ribosomal protein S18 acetylase RimI-like enzyme
VEARRATRDDIRPLAAVLARAFANDPFFGWLAGDVSERGQRMRDGWSAILRHASAGLAATWTTDDLTGAAIWIPPGMARMTTWRRLGQVSDAMEDLASRRRRHAPEPHWYLSALGVEPDRQGEGVGSALLAPVLAEADARREPAYLETAVGRNVLLYERHGFDVVEELVLPKTDIHGWLMLRQPRS